MCSRNHQSLQPGSQASYRVLKLLRAPMEEYKAITAVVEELCSWAYQKLR